MTVAAEQDVSAPQDADQVEPGHVMTREQYEQLRQQLAGQK
ncbi:hypothetical protein ACLB1G_21810 [Oxalobacteraceae bacterium A2-2]